MGRLTCLAPRVATLDTRSAKPPPKEADPFYLTPEHRDWREKVIARAGGQCEHRSPNGTRCFKTTPHVRLFADHIVEIKDGGSPLDLSNGQALCGQHHQLKTAAEKRKREASLS